MSVVQMSKTRTLRHEYRVRQPAAGGDVAEAMMFANRDKQAAGGNIEYTDSLTVVADEEYIIVYWEEQESIK